jgi:hypothetical protein
MLKAASVSSKPAVKLVTLTSPGDGDGDGTGMLDWDGLAVSDGVGLRDRVGDGEEMGEGDTASVVGEAEALTAGDGAKLVAHPLMIIAGTLPVLESVKLSSWTAQLVTIETDGVGDSGDQSIMTHDDEALLNLVTTQYCRADSAQLPNEQDTWVVPVTSVGMQPSGQPVEKGSPSVPTVYRFIASGMTARSTRTHARTRTQCWHLWGTGGGEEAEKEGEEGKGEEACTGWVVE